jgi:starch phosphorylase
MNRIKSILMQKERPVQIIIAGKAHPADNIGKELIKHIIHITRDVDLRHRIVFLEDYDMNVAHYLVQGADIWLNNPRRPAEASGTSGMKAAVNGVLNLSVLDGWWCEGYNGENGWIIGSGEEYFDQEYQDEVESKAIFDILEKDIVPLFYQRGHDGLPREWIRKMKTSMQTICPAFNTNRMIEDYTRLFYTEAAAANDRYKADNYAFAKRSAEWQKMMYKNWSYLKILAVEDNLANDITLGSNFTVKAKIKLGLIRPEDVCVQVFWGYLDSRHRMTETEVCAMKIAGRDSDGTYEYEGAIKGDRVGHCGYVVRVLPQIDGKVALLPNLISWQ